MYASDPNGPVANPTGYMTGRYSQRSAPRHALGGDRGAWTHDPDGRENSGSVSSSNLDCPHPEVTLAVTHPHDVTMAGIVNPDHTLPEATMANVH